MTGSTNGHNVREKMAAKYGKEEADRRWQAANEKRSLKLRGEKNHQFGKSSPQGSGNGWSGWYKGHYFRSLLELAYIVKELEPSGLPWTTGEQKGLAIPYVDHLNRPKTYLPDFLVDGRILVEVKPAKLQTSPKVKAKAEAARKFCEANGYKFQFVEPTRLPTSEHRRLMDEGHLVWLEKYKAKFEAWEVAERPVG